MVSHVSCVVRISGLVVDFVGSSSCTAPWERVSPASASSD